MRIDELKKIAEKNDYELTESLGYCNLERRSEGIQNRISIGNVHVNRLWMSIEVFCDEKDFNMIKAAVEFAETPIDEREEEKKFYLRHRYFRFYNGSSKYLGMNLVKDESDLCSKITYRWMKNQFTEKEIDKIKKKYNTDLKDFEMIEVEE